MANKWAVRAILATAVTLTVTGQASPAGAAAAPTASPQESPSVVDAALRRDLDLSLEQLRARQAKEAIAPDVEKSMRATLGERYGGTWLSRDGTLHVGVTGSGEITSITSAGATQKTVAYSERQLSGFQAALDRRAKAAPDSVYEWYVDVPNNRLVVTVLSGQTAAAQAFIAESGVSSQAVQIVTSDERPRPMADDLPAGERFHTSAGGCSTGFAVVGGGFVTAGHCGVMSFLTGPNGITFLGIGRGSSYPGNDYAWVSTVSNYTPIAQAKGLGVVAGSREAVIGTAVCRSGATTGVHCGNILFKNVHEDYGDGDIFGLTKTDACAEKGDSGGPFMAGDQAQGVASGGSGSCGPNGGTTLFQPINPILAAYGLTLLTGPSASPWWTQSPHNSERGTIRADFNGDGFEDVAAFYNYNNNQTKLFLFRANGSGGFYAPAVQWDSGQAGFDLSRVRLVAGDFNGDGRDDIMTFYDYGLGQFGMMVFRGNSSGGFDAPIPQGGSLRDFWDVNRTRLVAGDVNGDGSDDITAFYDYGTNHTGIWVLLGSPEGIYWPVLKWESTNWDVNRSRLVAGDVNGDGLDDITALFDHDSSRTRLWVFQADGSGGYLPPVVKWDSGRGNWELNRTRVVAGDFNGDGYADVGAFYYYGNYQTRLFAFLADGSGGFNPPTVQWDSGPGTWDLTRTRPIAGDFNGDGRTDIGAFYGYVNYQTKLFTLSANGSGGFGSPAVQWDSGPGTWYYDYTAPA